MMQEYTVQPAANFKLQSKVLVLCTWRQHHQDVCLSTVFSVGAEKAVAPVLMHSNAVMAEAATQKLL